MKNSQGGSVAFRGRNGNFLRALSFWFALFCALGASLGGMSEAGAETVPTGSSSIDMVDDGEEAGRGDAIVAAGKGSTRNGSVPAGMVALTQTITFGPNPGPQSPGVGAVFFVQATGGASGNPIVFMSLTTGICAVLTANMIAIGSPGICTIAANQAGNASYLAAPQATQDIVITLSPQSITFGANPGPVPFSPGGTFSVAATAYSGYGASTTSVTFTSLTIGVCSVSGTTVTILGIGTCTIAADSAGTSVMFPAPQVTQDIIINPPISQAIAFGPNPGPATYICCAVPAFRVSAAGGASGNPVTFTSLTPSVCSVFELAGPGAVFAQAGTCTIAANQAGNLSYLAAPQVTQDVIVNKRDQTIAFGANPGPVTYSPGGTFVATVAPINGLTDANPIITSSLTTGVCTISGSTVSIVTAGSCTIAADQAGSANYNVALRVTQTITINGFPQFISFGAAPRVVVGGMGNVSGAGGLSNNPLVFASVTPAVCTIVGSTVSGVTAGVCTITADQAGGIYYAAAPQATQSFNVVPVVTLSRVVSRKQHAGIDRDILIDHTLPIGGDITPEPRAIGAGHQIVFQFSGQVTQAGFAGAVNSALFDIGTAVAAINPLANNEVIVTLTGVPDNLRATVTLLNVNAIATPFSASLGFLVGDVSATRSVNSSDISGVKARSGQITDVSNFRFDVNANGTVNSSDISAVKARSGLTLAP